MAKCTVCGKNAGFGNTQCRDCEGMTPQQHSRSAINVGPPEEIVGSCKCNAQIQRQHQYDWCASCGEKLPLEIRQRLSKWVSPAQETAEVTSAPIATPHDIPCPICGETILSVAKKCKHCGEWLAPLPSVATGARPADTVSLHRPSKTLIDCEKCGKQIASNANECPKCGARTRHAKSLAFWGLVATAVSMGVFFPLIIRWASHR